MQIDRFGLAYLTMTLEIAKHIDGYVDSYYGPPEIKAGVEASPKKTPAALLVDLARLHDLLPADDAARHAYLTAMLRQVARVRGLAKQVNNNAAILHHSGQLDEEQAVDYIRTYALVSDKRARQSFSFITNPLFRSYPFTYTEGYDLIEKASGGGDKTPVFKRLLVSEVLPSALAALAP